jgi:hypothetical protein
MRAGAARWLAAATPASRLATPCRGAATGLAPERALCCWRRRAPAAWCVCTNATGSHVWSCQLSHLFLPHAAGAQLVRLDHSLRPCAGRAASDCACPPPPPHGMRVTRRGGLARIASTVRASSDGAGYARVQDNGALVAWSASTTYTMGLVRDCSIRCHVLYVLHSITATSPLSLLVHLTGEPECSARRRGRVWGVIRG